MKNQQGWTLIQTMLVLLVAGVLGSFAIDYIIDKRCESDPSRLTCAERQK